jgi:[acyl-carrier-protein] S-malonyltransferase
MTMPDKIGFLFPGQGSQAVGMGKDLYETHPAAKALFDQASQILGYSLTELCFNGPEDKLTRTLYAQPAIFTTSMAALRVLREKFPEMNASFYAGLSLGEFSALCAAGSIPFEDALRLVQKRAEAMERSAEHHPGTMASIMGLTSADCEAIAKEAGCEVANLNSPDQTALSGTVETIEKACKMAEAKGAKRALVLKVGGAFHSTLMREAKEDLEKALKVTRVQAPKAAFIPNATAQKTSNPDDIRVLLAKQLMSPLRWVETMTRAS